MEEAKTAHREGDSRTEKQLFGTFQLLVPNGSREQFDDFKMRNFGEILDQFGAKVTPKVILIMFRRHPEKCAYFLNYFDKEGGKQMPMKDYIPFLCYRISTIPVQWIARHVVTLADARYANIVVKDVFSSLQMLSHPFEEMHRKEQIWNEYRQISGIKENPTAAEAWRELAKLRASIKELLDYRLEVKISDYVFTEPQKLIEKMVSGSTSAFRLKTVLKTQLFPFAEWKGLSADDAIIAGMVKNEWPLRQKLEILDEFMKSPGKKEEAIKEMTYANEQEASILHDYARRNKLSYTRNPVNMRQQAAQQTVQRELSIPVARARTNPVRRSPSIDMSSMTIDAKTVEVICNGDPSDPVAYANKLRGYKNLAEFKPCYDLADKFNMCVSFVEMSSFTGRMQIFHDLMSRYEVSKFHEICESMRIENDEIVDMVCTSPCYYQHADYFIDNLVPFLTRGNVRTYLEYITESTRLSTNVEETVKSVINGLKHAMKLVGGDDIPQIAQRIHSAIRLRDEKCEEEEKRNRLCDVLSGSSEKSEFVNMSESEFIGSLASGEIEDVVNAVTQMEVIPKEVLVEYLKHAIPRIKGTSFALLEHVHHVVAGIEGGYEKEMTVLQKLYDIGNDDINFHELMRNPIDTLMRCVTKNNVLQFLELLELFELNGDKLLISLMIHKMDSLVFSDYAPYMSRVKLGNHVLFVVERLIERLLPSSHMDLLGSLKSFLEDNVYQTLHDLIANGMQSYIKEDYLEDPKSMLSEMCGDLATQERVGLELRNICWKIAKRFDIDMEQMEKEIALNLFETDMSTSLSASTSVFDLSMRKPDMQRPFFILLGWDQDVAVDWLASIVANKESSTYQKAMAMASLAIFGGAFGDDQAIPIYFATALDDIGYDPDVLPSHEKLSEMVDKENVLFLQDLFRYVIDSRIHDEELILKIIRKLRISEKRFLMPQMLRMFELMPVYNNDDIFRIFLDAVGSPLDEMMSSDQWKPYKGKQLDVLRDTFTAICQTPRPIDCLIFDDKEWTWSDLASKMCSVGAQSVIAEMGAHLVSRDHREAVFLQLMQSGHYDDVLLSGFDKDDVFTYIVNNSIKTATEIMVDSSFSAFTRWLADRKMLDAIAKVEESLVSQGRTMEAKRLRGKLGL